MPIFQLVISPATIIAISTRVHKCTNVCGKAESKPASRRDSLRKAEIIYHRITAFATIFCVVIQILLKEICTEIESLTNDETILKSFKDEQTLIENRHFAIKGRIWKFIEEYSIPTVQTHLFQTNYESITQSYKKKSGAFRETRVFLCILNL